MAMKSVFTCDGVSTPALVGVGRYALRPRVVQRHCWVVSCSSKSQTTVTEEETHAPNAAFPRSAPSSMPDASTSITDPNIELPSAMSVEESTSGSGSLLGPAVGFGAIVGVVCLSAYLKDDISAFLDVFVEQVKDMGPSGYFAYAGLYILLETLGLPATPLTLTAGYLFGQIPGTLVVSGASSAAAVIAFLIARYAVRDKVLDMAKNNKQFTAIDKAIKKDGFKFVFLLRLSPLLPFAASNYLYGLTSVETGPYLLASWLGMLPGTWAYVSAGSVGRDLLSGGDASFSPLQVGLAVALTGIALWGAGSIAQKAIAEVEEES